MKNFTISPYIPKTLYQISYPGLLKEVNLDMLMTGHDVNVENVGPSKIPPVDAGLFNNLYYLTFNEKDTQNFKENQLDNLHFEGNAKSSKTNIVTFLLFDILHKKVNKLLPFAYDDERLDTFKQAN